MATITRIIAGKLLDLVPSSQTVLTMAIWPWKLNWQVCAIPYGNDLICPVTALHSWIEANSQRHIVWVYEFFFQ